jgi:hypothetical protein|tara:strand:+ start:3602 stop:5161 length:1560 start_codon:yes stop_codon:yes gene_type:complete
MNWIKTTTIIAVAALTAASCAKQMDLKPKYGLNAETVYSDPNNYVNVLAKLYAGLAISGNQGPAGQPDIGGIDEGFSQYVRVLWNLQELPTDEEICGWSDPGIPELNTMTWNDNSSFVSAMYYRIYYQIALANEFIRYCSDEWMTDKGFTDAEKSMIAEYLAEARYLRALSYYHALDLFGNVPFVDESDRPGVYFPEQISRSNLFTWVESELNAIEPGMMAARTAPYGRADQGALWALRAKLYLNAEVYTGSPKYDLAMADALSIINAGYILESNYAYNFMADNHLSTEVIFPVTFDGDRTTTWGGSTFLVHSHIGGSMDQNDFGVNSGWQGNRATSAWYALFSDSADSREMVHLDGQEDTITDISTFTQGFPITKWTNMGRDGVAGADATFPDTDFTMFRLADYYLVYAECAERTGTNQAQGVAYFNMVRERAFGHANNNVTTLNLQQILDERGRELYAEAQRRSDLIRYDQFTGGSYLWPWKGESQFGASTSDHYNLYPLPSSDLIANPNLQQNEGY